MSLTVLQEALLEVFPVEGQRVEIRPPRLDGEGADWRLTIAKGSAVASVWLVVWDNPIGVTPRNLWSIKEQEVLLVPERHMGDLPRAAAYIKGWAMALEVALERLEEPDVLMPADLIFPRVLDLVRPRTAEDFAAALLVRSRLGKLIPK